MTTSDNFFKISEFFLNIFPLSNENHPHAFKVEQKLEVYWNKEIKLYTTYVICLCAFHRLSLEISNSAHSEKKYLK